MINTSHTLAQGTTFQITTRCLSPGFLLLLPAMGLLQSRRPRMVAEPAGELDLGLCSLLITHLPPWSSFPNLAKTLSRNSSNLSDPAPCLQQPRSFPAQRSGGHCYSGSPARSKPPLQGPQQPQEPEHRVTRTPSDL